MRVLAPALAAVLLLLNACQSTDTSSGAPSAQAIVDSAIAAHGGDVLDQAVMTFTFRGDQYRIRHNEGRFHYRRTYTDSLGRTVREGLTNDRIYRVVEGDTVSLSAEEKNAVETTVNSVSYFALLPYPLGDPAVQPHYSGRDTLDGVPYHRIKVTFRKKGGGKDWQDVFMYWFHPDTDAMDYLSYAFGLGPNDMDTGTRFREAYNMRRVHGVRVADYMNYTADTLATDRMHLYSELWAKDALELVSRVEIDSVQVRPLPPDVEATGTSRGSAWSPPPSHWPAYGGDPGGTRYSPLDQITRESVSELEVAWTFQTGELGRNAEEGGDLTFEATPIHFEGRLYFSTGYDEVIALDPVTGRALWRHDPGVDRSASYSEVTSRGVAVWRNPEAEPGTPCAARIFEGTIDGRLIALDAATGEPCEGFGQGGELALWRHAGVDPDARGDYQITSAPLVVDGRVVVGPSIGDNWSVDTGDGSVRAFDARTGELAWEWSPLEDREAGRVGAGNAWSTMSADPERGRVFVPTGSASPDFYGGLRPGDNRWANSVVALDAATGDRAWGVQTVHHDLFDYDVAAQPTLAPVARGDSTVPAVIQPTKTGLIFAMDRRDGTPLFGAEERSVPDSDVPGEHASPTQPVPDTPAPLVDDEGVDPDRPWDVDSAHVAKCRRMAEGFRYDGMFTPPSLEGSLVFPGNGAGTNWGGAAVDPERGVAIVPTNRFGTLIRLAENDEADEVARELRKAGWENTEPSRQEGAPYVMFRTTWVADGVFCTPPPFRVVTALDLDTGEVRWRTPLGGEGAWTSGVGGPIVTAGGVVFLAGTTDRQLRALDLASGDVLWRAELPRAGFATPMTYRGQDGRQYVVVAAGGHGKWGLEVGDYVVAFALPR